MGHLILIAFFILAAFISGCANLHSAARVGDIPKIKELLDKGADVYLNDNDGKPLRYLVAKCPLPLAKLLTEKGALVSLNKKMSASEVCSFGALNGNKTAYLMYTDDHLSVEDSLFTFHSSSHNELAPGKNSLFVRFFDSYYYGANMRTITRGAPIPLNFNAEPGHIYYKNIY